MFQGQPSVCLCAHLANWVQLYGHQLKVCNIALAFGSAFKSSFDCQVSWHGGYKASPLREGYVGSAKHHYQMDFLKAREVFPWPNKPAVGLYPNLIGQSCSCMTVQDHSPLAAV